MFSRLNKKNLLRPSIYCYGWAVSCKGELILE